MRKNLPSTSPLLAGFPIRCSLPFRFDPAGTSNTFGVDYLRIGSQAATPTKTITPTPTQTRTPTVTPTGPTPTATTIGANQPFSTSAGATFTYDGDGKMVKSVIDGVTTIFVSAAYQIKNPTGDAVVTKVYPGGVMRVGDVVYYQLSDHIGSSSVTVNADGNIIAEMRYKAWGEVRYQGGSMPTDRTYTGQRSYADDFGLMYYNARWYDSSLGRFSQADTVIPDGVQGYDRYAYVSNNPIMHNDPTGHNQCDLIPPGSARDACNSSGYGQQQQQADVQKEKDILSSTVRIIETRRNGSRWQGLGTVVSFMNRIVTAGHIVNSESTSVEIIDSNGNSVSYNLNDPALLLSYSREGDGLSMTLPSDLPLQVTPATPATMFSWDPGKNITVAYQNEAGFHTLDTTLSSPSLKSATSNHYGLFAWANNPGLRPGIVNGGDSGGGVFYNGEFIGSNSGIGYPILAIQPYY